MNEDTERKIKRGRKPSQLELFGIYQVFKHYRRYLYVAISRMPRWIQVSEGANCISSTKSCIRCLSVAARTYDRELKLRQLDMFLTEWDAAFDSISFFFEVKGISKKQRTILLNYRENIEGQVKALRKWCIEEMNNTSANI